MARSAGQRTGETLRPPRGSSPRGTPHPEFGVRTSLNADPDPGLYLNADPDLCSGFQILDPDQRSVLQKNLNKFKIKKNNSSVSNTF